MVLTIKVILTILTSNISNISNCTNITNISNISNISDINNIVSPVTIERWGKVWDFFFLLLSGVGIMFDNNCREYS